MIAREEVAIGMEQHHVSGGVAGRGNGRETGRQLKGLEALDDLLRLGLGLELQPMDEAARAEMAGIIFGVGYVIARRQKDARQAAERFEFADQRRQELGRIDEPITGRVPDKIAAAAV